MASFNYAIDKGIVVSFKCIFVYIMQLSESKVILILAVKGGSVRCRAFFVTKNTTLLKEQNSKETCRPNIEEIVDITTFMK